MKSGNALFKANKFANVHMHLLGVLRYAENWPPVVMLTYLDSCFVPPIWILEIVIIGQLRQLKSSTGTHIEEIIRQTEPKLLGKNSSLLQLFCYCIKIGKHFELRSVFSLQLRTNVSVAEKWILTIIVKNVSFGII